MPVEKYHPQPDYDAPRVTPLTRLARWGSYQIESRILPVTVIDEYKTLQSLDNPSIREEGNIIVFTHFGKGDLIPLLFSIICHAPHIRRRPALAPQSWHQYDPRVGRLVEALGGKLIPIVNENTENDPEFLNLSNEEKEYIRSQLDDNYFHSAENILFQGGTVAVAVDAGRSTYLDMSMKHRPLGTLHAALKRSDFRGKYGIIPVALSLEGVDDYSKQLTGGLNLNERYCITVGERLTFEAIKALSGSKLETITRSKLLKIVPSSYLDPRYPLSQY